MYMYVCYSVILIFVSKISLLCLSLSLSLLTRQFTTRGGNERVLTPSLTLLQPVHLRTNIASINSRSVAATRPPQAAQVEGKGEAR